MRVPMIATRTMTYGTRRLKADEAFEATRPNARLLAALGRARLVEAVEEPQAEEPRAERPQLDHDNDGKEGGSAKGETSTRRKGARRKAARKAED
jgi:hypothetical protein